MHSERIKNTLFTYILHPSSSSCYIPRGTFENLPKTHNKKFRFPYVTGHIYSKYITCINMCMCVCVCVCICRVARARLSYTRCVSAPA